MWCLSFIDFFSVIFALASYNFDIIIKKQTFFCELFILTILSWHGFTNSKLCSLKSNKKFTHSDLVQTLNFNKICEFSEFKIGETISGNLLCSYFPQPHELEPQLRLWSLGSGGIYGSYGAAVTGFPARTKIDPGWGLYPINPGLLPLEVQNCLKNF